MSKSKVAKTTNQSRRVFAIVLILAGLPNPVCAEWILEHSEPKNRYNAWSDAVPVEVLSYVGSGMEVIGHVSVFFSCSPQNRYRKGMLAMTFTQDPALADHPKPIEATLGRKVGSRLDSIGKPILTYRPPVRQAENEPRIVVFSPRFLVSFLEYLESAKDDRKHLLELSIIRNHESISQRLAFTYSKNISLANAKVSIRAAQKMCE